MLSWTLWRKQLFLSYVQLVLSRADVKGRGLQRAAVLTPSSPQQQAVYSHGCKAATSCSITIKNRNEKYKPDTEFLQQWLDMFPCVGSVMHVPDARLPPGTPEEGYLFAAGADVYLCQRHIRLPAV